MAKFYMEDGSVKSGDRIMDELREKVIRSSLRDRTIMNTPVGCTNRDRLLNTNIYDLLCNISDNVDGCIIESITGKHHDLCCNTSDCHECIRKWLNSDKW